MAIEWYAPNGSSYVEIGVDWNVQSDTTTSVSVAPVIYRWDSTTTNNYGSYWWETLEPDPAGDGSWSGLTWSSGSGTRQVDSFSTRTYYRTKSAQTVTMTIGWDESFGTYYSGSFHTLGSGNNAWTLTVDPLPSYTVTYNANNGTNAPASQTKWYDEALTLSSDIPTRSGYRFLGWGTSASTATVSYAPGASYTGNAAITLYAIWEVVKTCTLAYDANSGTGAPVSQEHQYEQTSILSTTQPTRDDYVFLGWAMTSTATRLSYLPGGRYTNNNFNNGDTIVFYAVWGKIRTIKMRVPDGSSVERIKVRIPDGKSLDTVLYKED